jgi:hypothetical protein
MLLALVAPAVYAEPFASTNYRIDESSIGNGSDVNSASTSYTSDGAIGETAVGESASTSFQTQSGYVTTSDPALTFSVNTSTINFGALSTSSAATATSTFSVINYTSYGYVVQTLGAPPSTGGYTLAGLGSAQASQTGTEQFGINLKLNSSPTTLGANPVGGFGVAAGGYDSANNYKYVVGDIIASAPKTSGQTDFTISYIVNASTTTAGGTYSGAQVLVCTGTY